MNPKDLPPRVGPDDRIVLFDAVCKLCGAWARFLIRHDRRGVFKLCSVQSEAGRDILAFHGLPTDTFDTMLLVEGSTVHVRSSAFFRVMRGLGLPWSLVLVFWLIPRPLRDWLYDRIALNRYRWFGRHDYCVLPSPDHAGRFVGD
jgi:predicted DCC family thiol-disulfide oxidoreductase YuxK